MNKLKIFENPDFGEVRTITNEGEPWFVAADVCRALELDKTWNALQRLDDDEKGTTSISTLGGTQEMSIINEPGLYTLVLGSRKPEAKAFKRWITHEVIPTIRKTGSYVNRQLSPLDLLEQQVLVMRGLEERQSKQEKALVATNARLDVIKDTIQINPNAWREECRKIITRIATEMGGFEHIKTITNEIYDLVDTRGAANLQQRRKNKQHRMADEGVCKSKRDKVTKLDIVADDKRLTEIYIAIVKEYAIKYLDSVA